jgi:hypothetical protein
MTLPAAGVVTDLAPTGVLRASINLGNPVSAQVSEITQRVMAARQGAWDDTPRSTSSGCLGSLWPR